MSIFLHKQYGTYNTVYAKKMGVPISAWVRFTCNHVNAKKTDLSIFAYLPDYDVMLVQRKTVVPIIASAAFLAIISIPII